MSDLPIIAYSQVACLPRRRGAKSLRFTAIEEGNYFTLLVSADARPICVLDRESAAKLNELLDEFVKGNPLPDPIESDAVPVAMEIAEPPEPVSIPEPEPRPPSPRSNRCKAAVERRWANREIDPSLGPRLKAERLRRQWTVKQLAHHLGCTPASIYKYEAGLAFPDTQIREAIKEFFGETPQP